MPRDQDAGFCVRTRGAAAPIPDWMALLGSHGRRVLINLGNKVLPEFYQAPNMSHFHTLLQEADLKAVQVFRTHSVRAAQSTLPNSAHCLCFSSQLWSASLFYCICTGGTAAVSIAEAGANQDRETESRTASKETTRPQMKVCTKCMTARPSSLFYQRSASKDGLQAWCKECRQQVVGPRSFCTFRIPGIQSAKRYGPHLAG